MIVTTLSEEIKTRGRDDCIDITHAVQDAIHKGKLRSGIAVIFVTGSTAGVTTIEYEPGLVKDLAEAVRRIFPESLRYAHNMAAGDDNGHSHLRASFIGPSVTIPVVDGNLQLGTWQQIVLIDFDVRPRSRSFSIQLIGE